MSLWKIARVLVASKILPNHLWRGRQIHLATKRQKDQADVLRQNPNSEDAQQKPVTYPTPFLEINVTLECHHGRGSFVVNQS